MNLNWKSLTPRRNDRHEERLIRRGARCVSTLLPTVRETIRSGDRTEKVLA